MVHFATLACRHTVEPREAEQPSSLCEAGHPSLPQMAGAHGEITKERPKAWQGSSLPEGLRPPTKNQHLGLERRCGKRLRKVNVIDQDTALDNYKSYTNYDKERNLTHSLEMCSAASPMKLGCIFVDTFPEIERKDLM